MPDVLARAATSGQPGQYTENGVPWSESEKYAEWAQEMEGRGVPQELSSVRVVEELPAHKLKLVPTRKSARKEGVD